MAIKKSRPHLDSSLYNCKCKIRYVPLCQILEDQKTQDAQDDGESHEETGYPVEEPEQSSETYDGHGGPYGGYAVRVKPAEYDGGRDSQCGSLCPPVAGYFLDPFYRFHNLHVFKGMPFPFPGPSCGPSPRARLSGKIPQPFWARMIFP